MNHHLSPAMRSGSADIRTGLHNPNGDFIGRQKAAGGRTTVRFVVVVRGLEIGSDTLGLLEGLHLRNRRTASPTGFSRLGLRRALAARSFNSSTCDALGSIFVSASRQR